MTRAGAHIEGHSLSFAEDGLPTLRLRVAMTALAILVLALALTTTASAHPLDPALLELRESANGAIDVLWRMPAAKPAGPDLNPLFPPGCHESAPHRLSMTLQSVTQRWSVNCGGRSLVGRQISIAGLRERQSDVLVRIHLADGRLIQAVLRADSPSLTVTAQSGWRAVFRTYLALGLGHILTGPDHLLFLLGLVLLVHGWRPLVETVTAFTLGHSVTLSAVALGVVHIAPRPVEALIALTIFAVAIELARDIEGRALSIGRTPWMMACGFGLLHGLGFAGALAQIGLPPNEIPLALFSFNCGIEIGQLMFVVVVLAACLAVRAAPQSWRRSGALIPAYTIGSLAAFWFFQRCAAMLPWFTGR
jgi:hypothetical protein